MYNFVINRIVIGMQKALTEKIIHFIYMYLMQFVLLICFGTFTFIDMIVIGMTEALQLLFVLTYILK